MKPSNKDKYPCWKPSQQASKKNFFNEKENWSEKCKTKFWTGK